MSKRKAELDYPNQDLCEFLLGKWYFSQNCVCVCEITNVLILVLSNFLRYT